MSSYNRRVLAFSNWIEARRRRRQLRNRLGVPSDELLFSLSLTRYDDCKKQLTLAIRSNTRLLAWWFFGLVSFWSGFSRVQSDRRTGRFEGNFINGNLVLLAFESFYIIERHCFSEYDWANVDKHERVLFEVDDTDWRTEYNCAKKTYSYWRKVSFFISFVPVERFIQLTFLLLRNDYLG